MKRPDPVEIVCIAVPVLVEAVVVLGFIAMGALWIVLASTAGPV